MEETPIIVMQCPKCRKEFPLDTNYCEDCTAMLEPTEKAQEAPIRPMEPLPSTSPVEAAEASDEQIEDVRIDSLKTDIEESFVSALLYELKRLRDRREKKETALSDLQKQREEFSSPDLVQKIGRAEAEVNEALKRTAKIEAILDNLRKKLEADIDRLHAQITDAERPGWFAVLSAAGRYFRMLSAEARTKKELLAAIETRTYSKKNPLLKYAFFIVLLLIIAGALTMFSRKGGVLSSSATSDKASAKASGQAKDIYDLLEDIRQANIKKDLTLWESRYSRQYLEAGRKKYDTAENWKKFDFLSLQYRVTDIRMLPGEITAVISWDMELRSKESGRVTRTVQTLLSAFVVEDHKLKIASVRKAGQ